MEFSAAVQLVLIDASSTLRVRERDLIFLPPANPARVCVRVSLECPYSAARNARDVRSVSSFREWLLADR
jgi:hypothetical protein